MLGGSNFLRWPFPTSFSLFLIFSIVQLVDKISPMKGFELRISGVGSDHSTNWAPTNGVLFPDERCLVWTFFWAVKNAVVGSQLGPVIPATADGVPQMFTWRCWWSIPVRISRIFHITITPTIPSASQRQGSRLTRSGPRPQPESTLIWVPASAGGAI